MIPILINHEQTEVIGVFKDGVFTLREGYEVTRTELFNCFGNSGIQIIDSIIKDGVTYIKQWRVLEWSLDK